MVEVTAASKHDQSHLQSKTRNTVMDPGKWWHSTVDQRTNMRLKMIFTKVGGNPTEKEDREDRVTRHWK